WGNSAVIAGLLLGTTFSQQGAKMKPGSVLSLGEMPFYYYTDSDGDQTALPCTERMLSSKMAELVSKHRFMPMLSMKGRPEVRLGGFGALSGGVLAGPWAPVTGSTPSSAAPAPAPEAAEPQAEADSTETAEAGTSAEPTEPAEPTAEATEPPAEAAAVDPELDSLLASLNEETAPA